jgi:hypothetical protein
VREENIEAAVEDAYAKLDLSEAKRLSLETEVTAFLEESEESTKRIQQTWRLQLAALQTRHDRLVDALLEGTIDKEAFEPRKKRLLMEERELEERLSRDTSEEQITTRLREILEILTSNRRVNREAVVVELSFPFCLLVGQKKLNKCGRTPDSTRSGGNLSEAANNSDLEPRHVIEQIFNWIRVNPEFIISAHKLTDH